MSIKDEKKVFSVSIDLILKGKPLPYDLYINSSLANKAHFVKIFSSGNNITERELKGFKSKYYQLYVSEDQRNDFLSSLVSNSSVEDEKKVEVVKDSALNYLDKVFDPDREFSTEVLDEAISDCKKSVEQMVQVVKNYELGDLRKLIGTLSFHDFYTFDHSVNVSMYSVVIYKGVHSNASDEELTLVGLSGMLHDIGKIKMPTDLINKAEKLTDGEIKTIRNHPGDGKNILENQNFTCEGIDFETVKRVVSEHHENFCGTGYPSKLKGEEIHYIARIVAIADFFDAITTKRTYHEVLSTPDALAVMEKSKGKKLDPELFELFVKSLKNFGMGQEKRILDEDYDPCRPQNELPFMKMKPQKQDHDLYGGQKKEDYGEIKRDFTKKKKAS